MRTNLHGVPNASFSSLPSHFSHSSLSAGAADIVDERYPLVAPEPDPTPETRLELQHARAELIAPLFTYLAEHGITAIFVARAAARRVGIPALSRCQLQRIKNGYGRLPFWFIAGICREIGQPIETVMGQEWAQRHMPRPDAPDAPDTDTPDADAPDGERAKRAS